MFHMLGFLASVATIWGVIHQFLKGRKKVQALNESESVDDEIEVAKINRILKQKKDKLKS